jgi:putative membrane protein
MMGFNLFGWHGMSALRGLHHGFGMMGVTGGIVMILLIALAIVAIIWFSKNWSFRNNTIQTHPASDRSLEILNERYALGEIGDEEYSKKKIELLKRV